MLKHSLSRTIQIQNCGSISKHESMN